MTDEKQKYPVPGRSPEKNYRIAVHEIGHALVGRALGSKVWSVSIIPDRGPNGYEGRCVRSAPSTELIFDPGEKFEDQTEEILTVCERLERMTPILGSNRIVDAEIYLRAQSNVIELLAGEAAESILCPDDPPLGTVHDLVEAAAFARIAVAAQPATMALVDYCLAESKGIIEANLDIAEALVYALVQTGTMSGDEVDVVIADCIAARSVEKERLRRIDWQRRQDNAAAFQIDA